MDKRDDPQHWAVEIEVSGDHYGIWLSNPHLVRPGLSNPHLVRPWYERPYWHRSSLPAAERKGSWELAKLRKRLTRDNERRAELKSKGY